MKILAIDTAHGTCSVAISNGGIIIAEKTEFETSKQAERLFPIINELLEENNLTYKDIGAIAVDIGPGSFTGVRIGLAAAHGMAIAAKVPLIGVSGFEALNFNSKENNLLVVLDARRGQVFVQLFDNDVGSEPAMLEYSDVESILKTHSGIKIIGNSASLIKPFINDAGNNLIEDIILPKATMIAVCAFDKFNRKDFTQNPAPLYIRPPDAKLPQNK